MATLRSYCANCWKFNDKLAKNNEKCICVYAVDNYEKSRTDWKGNFYEMEKGYYNPKMRPQFWKRMSDFVKYY
jgi:hypothetical protein